MLPGPSFEDTQQFCYFSTLSLICWQDVLDMLPGPSFEDTQQLPPSLRGFQRYCTSPHYLFRWSEPYLYQIKMVVFNRKKQLSTNYYVKYI